MSANQIIPEINKALQAHGAWKLRLRTVISCGKSDFHPRDVKCDNLCEFGKWLYGPTLDAQVRAGMPYKVIKRLHAEFHECASKVLSLALNGQIQEANELMEGEYSERSEKLARALSKWKRELTQSRNAA